MLRRGGKSASCGDEVRISSKTSLTGFTAIMTPVLDTTDEGTTYNIHVHV